MDALRIAVIRVAGGTGLDHSTFVSLPRSQCVDVFMAVLALNVIDEMGACIVLCAFLLMTPMARDRFCMNSRTFRFGMGFNIRDIIVAAVTGVGSMNGLGKFPLADLRMAAQTFGIVNALIAILPAFDNKLLRFFGQLRRLGRLCRLDTFFAGSGCCRVQCLGAPKEQDGEDQTTKD